MPAEQDAHRLYQQIICRTRPIARAPARNVTWHLRGARVQEAAAELLQAGLVAPLYLPGGYAVLDPKPGRRG